MCTVCRKCTIMQKMYFACRHSWFLLSFLKSALLQSVRGEKAAGKLSDEARQVLHVVSESRHVWPKVPGRSRRRVKLSPILTLSSLKAHSNSLLDVIPFKWANWNSIFFTLGVGDCGIRLIDDKLLTQSYLIVLPVLSYRLTSPILSSYQSYLIVLPVLSYRLGVTLVLCYHTFWLLWLCSEPFLNFKLSSHDLTLGSELFAYWPPALTISRIILIVVGNHSQPTYTMNPTVETYLDLGSILISCIPPFEFLHQNRVLSTHHSIDIQTRVESHWFDQTVGYQP